jgi:hypothetical protein
MSLTASIVDCLSAVVNWMEQNGFDLPWLSNSELAIQQFLKVSEIEEATARVRVDANKYAASLSSAAIALQQERENEREEEEILEWICHSGGSYLTPKLAESVVTPIICSLAQKSI